MSSQRTVGPRHRSSSEREFEELLRRAAAHMKARQPKRAGRPARPRKRAA